MNPRDTAPDPLDTLLARHFRTLESQVELPPAPVLPRDACPPDTRASFPGAIRFSALRPGRFGEWAACLAATGLVILGLASLAPAPAGLDLLAGRISRTPAARDAGPLALHRIHAGLSARFTTGPAALRGQPDAVPAKSEE